MTNSTGKDPPPWSADGKRGKVRISGMVLALLCTSGRISNVLRSRSLQGCRSLLGASFPFPWEESARVKGYQSELRDVVERDERVT